MSGAPNLVYPKDLLNPETAVPGKAREIFSTTLIYSVGTLLTQFVSFLLLPVYTRYLTPADYGAPSLVMVGQSLIVLATELGIVSGLFRFHHHFDTDEERSRLLGTVLHLLIGTGAVIFIGVQWFAPEIAAPPFLRRLTASRLLTRDPFGDK